MGFNRFSLLLTLRLALVMLLLVALVYCVVQPGLHAATALLLGLLGLLVSSSRHSGGSHPRPAWLWY